MKKVWVYAYQTPSYVTQSQMSLVNKRVTVLSNGWKFTCFEDDKDYTNSGLHPRTEIRYLPTFKLTEKYMFEVEIIPNQLPSNLIFMQLMSYMGKATPFLQLELQRNVVNVRYLQPSPVNLVRKKIGVFQIGVPIKFEMELRYPEIKLKYDGKDVFSYQYHLFPHLEFWIQFGLYRNQSPDTIQSVIISQLHLYKE